MNVTRNDEGAAHGSDRSRPWQQLSQEELAVFAHTLAREALEEYRVALEVSGSRAFSDPSNVRSR